MNRAAVVAQAQQFRRAGVDPRPVPPSVADRWWGRVLSLAVGAGLLTAAFAPAGQWYLAPVGLVPWLVVLHGCQGQGSAFFWSWVGGTFFFIANMWWMAAVTGPGMVGLMVILGLYWGYAGLIVRGAGLMWPATGGEWRRPWRWPTVRVLLLAGAWVAAAEWFRGTWPWHGLPWLYLGYTQSPVLTVCQIADVTGVAGVSFVVVAVNGWVAMWVVNRLSVRRLVPAGLMVLGLVAAVVGYGQYRLRTEPARLVDGPRVVVVQPNVPQDNSGEKGATQAELVDYHLTATKKALADAADVDLIVWSETMMPPMAAVDREFMSGSGGDLARQTYKDVQNLAGDNHAAVLTGGTYLDLDVTDGGTKATYKSRSNVAYFFNRHGMMDEQVYKKIHLVPYGEFTPFKEGCPPLYKLALKLGPPDMVNYELTPGSEDDLTVFDLARPDGQAGRPWRLVSPICFEDIDPDLCARMCRPDGAAGATAGKRADVLVNVTNDGWFQANENAQHLQAAVFRSIENRVPTARAVNTGISGFVDPLGRTYGLLRPRTDGTSVGVLKVDDRVTTFTRVGERFARACVAVTIVMAGLSLVAWGSRRYRNPGAASPSAAAPV